MKKIIILIAMAITLNAQADVQFTNITSTDFEQISKEMSANFTHNSMMGAAKLGTVFGFQVGLTGAQTATPNTNAIVKRNAGSELPNLYNVGLLGAVGIPFGLSAEVVMFPSFSSSGASMSGQSVALKWNINEKVPILPLNLAVRAFYSNASFAFQQIVSTVNVEVKNKTSINGVQILMSPMLPLIDPYIGVGLLNGSNVLSVTGTTSIFDSSFSTALSETKNVSTTQLIAGVDLNLVLIKLGAEYSQAFGTSRTGLKLSMGF